MSDEFSRYLMAHSICVTQDAMFIVVNYACLGKGKIKHPCVWASAMAAAAIIVGVVCNASYFSAFSITASTLYLLASVLVFGGTFGEKLVACMINGIVCLLTDNMVSFLLSRLTGIPPHLVWQKTSCLVIINLSLLVAFLLVAAAVRQWRGSRVMEPLQILVLSFFPLIVVVLNIMLMVTHTDEKVTVLNLMLTVGLTFAVLIHVAIVQLFNQQVVRQRESRYRADLEQQRAEALLQSYTEQRRLTHEFTNHMDSIALLLENGDVEGAKTYLSQVSKHVRSHTSVVNSHNPLLDSLFSQKYFEASKRGVTLSFDLSDLGVLPIEMTDLVIVVSNLLNNAIEAAAKADPPEVYVRIKKSETELLMSVRNRVQKDVELVDGQLPHSTKKEPGHGMGLMNVCAVLDKYHAEYTLSCHENWFRFTCGMQTANYDNSVSSL